MNFSLIICTYQRPKALLQLLDSVQTQTLYPNEIIIIDGSLDIATGIALETKNYVNVIYFKVEAADRGLTKQRNIGISKVSTTSEIVCFLDDDIILKTDYFEQLIGAYTHKPNAIAVGGYITNEVTWTQEHLKNGYCRDGYCRKESVRFKLRKIVGLIDETSPGYMPIFSHGRSISYLPPSNKIYKVESFMGGVSSYKKEVFEKVQFSTYFEGYGLYEDLDFCLRISKFGNLYVNTAAQLEHHHDQSGRPNKFTYGKMVVRNGWYVWRVKYPNPSFKASVLFHLNVLFLMKLRFINVITEKKKKEALTEAFGRLIGWFSLFLKAPKLK